MKEEEIIERARAFLGNEKLLELNNDYKFNKKLKIGDLVEKYNFKSAFTEKECKQIATKMYAILPAFDSEKECEYCHVKLKYKVGSRPSTDEEVFFCPKCGHNGESNPSNCSCKNCVNKVEVNELAKRELAVEKLRKQIKDFLATIKDEGEYDFSKAPNIAKIAVYIICKFTDECNSFAKQYKNGYVLPEIDHARIVENLEKSGIYKIDKEEILKSTEEVLNYILNEPLYVITEKAQSVIDANIREKLCEFFKFDGEGNIQELNDPSLTLNINLNDEHVRKQVCDVVALRKVPAEQLVQTWRCLAENDCIVHLIYNQQLLVDKGSRDIGDVEALITEAIKYMSARKICSIIWSAYNYTSGIKVKGNYESDKHLENIFFKTVIKNLTQNLTRCQTENIKDNGVGVRDFNCPTIIFNKIFFDDILQIGEDGFNLVPCKENLKPKDIFNDDLYREEEKQGEKLDEQTEVQDDKQDKESKLD